MRENLEGRLKGGTMFSEETPPKAPRVAKFLMALPLPTASAHPKTTPEASSIEEPERPPILWARDALKCFNFGDLLPLEDEEKKTQETPSSAFETLEPLPLETLSAHEYEPKVVPSVPEPEASEPKPISFEILPTPSDAATPEHEPEQAMPRTVSYGPSDDEAVSSSKHPSSRASQNHRSVAPVDPAPIRDTKATEETAADKTPPAPDDFAVQGSHGLTPPQTLPSLAEEGSLETLQETFQEIAEQKEGMEGQVSPTTEGGEGLAAEEQERLAAEQFRRSKPRRAYNRLFALCVVFTLFSLTFFAWWRHVQRNSPSNLEREARLLFEEAHYEAAEESYRHAIELHPGHLSFWTGLAGSAEKAGRHETAAEAWRQLSERLPQEASHERARALYERGRLSLILKEWGTARETLERSVALDSTNGEAHLALGQLWEHDGALTKALAAYKRALSVRPSSEAAANAVARVTELIPKPKEPFKDLEKERAQIIQVGLVALNLKRYEEAIRCFTEALAIRSDDARGWTALAEAQRAKGMFDDAKVSLQRALARDPKNEEVKARLAALQQKLEPPKKRVPSAKSTKK